MFIQKEKRTEIGKLEKISIHSIHPFSFFSFYSNFALKWLLHQGIFGEKRYSRNRMTIQPVTHFTFAALKAYMIKDKMYHSSSLVTNGCKSEKFLVIRNIINKRVYLKKSPKRSLQNSK